MVSTYQKLNERVLNYIGRVITSKNELRIPCVGIPHRYRIFVKIRVNGENRIWSIKRKFNEEITSRLTLPGAREMPAFFLILANKEGFRGNRFHFLELTNGYVKRIRCATKTHVDAGCSKWLTSRLGGIQPDMVTTKPLLRQSLSDYQYFDITIRCTRCSLGARDHFPQTMIIRYLYN